MKCDVGSRPLDGRSRLEQQMPAILERSTHAAASASDPSTHRVASASSLACSHDCNPRALISCLKGPCEERAMSSHAAQGGRQGSLNDAKHDGTREEGVERLS